MPELKETKSQRIERLKRSKNAWDHLDEIRNFARLGFDSIPPEWLSTYFRTWGVYTQGDGVGVTGGSGGEGRAVPFFMLRIRVPNGLLTSVQLRTIAALSDECGNGVADITVRQNIQLHWLKLESLPEVFERLQSVGLRTTGACGDVVRNITGCPLAGLHSHEIADVSPVVLALDKELAGNPEFYNLPRKFKITVTGCPVWCSYPEINDIALTATFRPRASAGAVPALELAPGGAGFQSANARTKPQGREELGRVWGSELQLRHQVPAKSGLKPLLIPVSSSASLANPGPGISSFSTPAFPSTTYEFGFSLRVAGGLSTQPHLAVRLNAFVKPDQVVPVVRAITEVFRSSEVLRQSRERARMKFLFLEHGWTPETFLAAVHARLGFTLDPAEPELLPSEIHRDHLGVIAQKQQGLFSVGASVIRGRITPSQLRLAADLAERFADGKARATPMQNLLLVNVPVAHVSAVVAELTAGGLPVASSAFVRGTVACTGSEFCKLALTETKGFARWLTETLEERYPGFDDELKLHITGCPNSCGQHWIADIGIEGKKIKVDGRLVDAYYFCVGGSVGHIASIARPVGYRCCAEEVPAAISRLFDAFHADRHAGESLQHFLARHSNDVLRSILAGGLSLVALRDLPEAHVPHCVEDRS
jgi:sulfite reductase beta subunit-like hemoprotein